MIDLVAGIIILIGALFSLIAGIGLYRLPDIFVRMHAATKAGTLGAGLVLLAIAVDSQDLGVITRAIAGFGFLLLTAAPPTCRGRNSGRKPVSMNSRTSTTPTGGGWPERRRPICSPANATTLIPAEARGI